MSKNKVLVVGAGAVGSQLACLLSKSGYETCLIDKDNDIIVGGASVTANLGHYDGFEYCHPSHRKTGEMCIDGGLTFPMFYKPHVFENPLTNPDNPVKFLVSKKSIALGERTENKVLQGFSWDNFVDNAAHMQNHYRTRHDQLSEKLSLSSTETSQLLYGPPEIMGRLLDASEYEGVSGIQGGVAGIGAVVSIPLFYATVKDAIRKEEAKGTLKTNFQNTLLGISRDANGGYRVTLESGDESQYDMVILCGGNQNPALIAKTNKSHKQHEGTYYLNLMTYVSFKPKTEKLGTYFTIQQDDGCMLCIHQAATQERAGFGAIYYPSLTGSQFLFCSSEEYSSETAAAWECYMKNGLPREIYEERKDTILGQACKIYPFLEGQIEIEKIIARSVFNAATKDSFGGLDRRVREAQPVASGSLMEDGRVIAVTSPKWTTSLATALETLDYVEQRLRGNSLARMQNGYTSANLDLGSISKYLNFHDAQPSIQDAYNYTHSVGLPLSIIGDVML